MAPFLSCGSEGSSHAGDREVTVEVGWERPWHLGRMPEAAELQLNTLEKRGASRAAPHGVGLKKGGLWKCLDRRFIGHDI